MLRGVLEELGKDPLIQVIYVTHSPSTINTMRPGSIRVLSRHQVDGVATTWIENASFEDNYIRVRSSLGLNPSDSLLYAPTAKLTLVVGEDGREVESGDGVGEEVDEVALGEPVMWRGREEVALVGGPIAIRLGHATLEAGRI